MTKAFSATGVAFARYILVGCWKNLIDTLSTPLTGRMAGSSKGLAFILGAEGIKEQNQKERDAICMSLDGLRKAARLSCALGIRVARGCIFNPGAQGVPVDHLVKERNFFWSVRHLENKFNVGNNCFL